MLTAIQVEIINWHIYNVHRMNSQPKKQQLVHAFQMSSKISLMNKDINQIVQLEN